MHNMGSACTFTFVTLLILGGAVSGVLPESLTPAAQGGEASVWPTGGWTAISPHEAGMDPVKLAAARDHALTGGGSGMITRGGRLVMSWGNLSTLYDLKSTTKSIGVTALGLAMADGLLVPSDLAGRYLPGIGIPPESNASTSWIDTVSVFHLATQTAGFDKSGGYTA